MVGCFRIKTATNAAGIGPASSNSNSVIPTRFTITDALQALMISVGSTVANSSQILKFDMAPMVNGVSVGDGKIDIDDVVVILLMAIGLI